MNPLFLQPLLSLLSKEGFCITARDYRRISIALDAEVAWTVESLKDVLLALLVKNPMQEELFLRQFESVFSAQSENPAFGVKYDLNKAIVELRNVVEEASNHPASQPLVIESIEPSRIITGSRDFTVTISGDNFIPSARVFVDSRELSTHFINSREISATVPSIFASSICTYRIVVCTQDGENCSNPASLEILPAPQNKVIAFLSKALGAISFEQSLVFGVILLLAGIIIVSLTPKQPNVKEQSSPVVSAMPGIPLPTASPTPTPVKETATCQGPTCKTFAISILGMIFLYCFYLDGLMILPKDKPRAWNPSGPKHFPLEHIGGKPTPHLSPANLNELAESLRFYESQEIDNLLDIDASVEETGCKGGLTTFIYQKKKNIPVVVIIEDAYAEPTTWNSVPRELAEGLRRRGIEVLYGKFFEFPLRLYASNHMTYRLDWLKEQNNLLLFYFSDSKCFDNDNAYTLKLLSQWQNVAWMELREQKFWDENTSRVALQDIPVFPATPDGLLMAVLHLSAQNPPPKLQNAADWVGFPLYSGGNLYTYVEYVLGDALPWAQACAMIQPITLGLADRLRLEFQPHLPAERAGRLFALPNSTYNNAGLSFSTPILSVLRHGFTLRWSEHEQRRILSFILERIQETEPAHIESLAHLTWEYVYQRVNLEVDPDTALSKLAALVHTPLRHAIKAEFKRVMLPVARQGRKEVSNDRVPLRREPVSPSSWKRLEELTGSIEIPVWVPDILEASKKYLIDMRYIIR
jgi:hypothetical protein